MVDPFNKPQQLINWSRSALTGAESLIREFFTSANFPLGWVSEPHSDARLLVMRMTSKIPDGVERFLTECINNTKNSFDQTICNAIDLVGEDSKNIHYPWADNPQPSLENKLRHPKTGAILIPPLFWDTLRNQQPYPTGKIYIGGSDIIRQIAKYANRKHSLGLSVDCGIARGEREITFETKEGTINFEQSTNWRKHENRVILARLQGDVPVFKMNAKIRFRFLMDAPLPLGETNVLDALKLFVDKSQQVLDEFRAVCATQHP